MSETASRPVGNIPPVDPAKLVAVSSHVRKSLNLGQTHDLRAEPIEGGVSVGGPGVLAFVSHQAIDKIVAKPESSFPIKRAA